MKIFAIFIALILGAEVVTAQTPIYTEQYAGTSLPAGWLVTNAGSGNLWDVVATGGYTGSGSTGTSAMQYTYNVNHSANVWAFTQDFMLDMTKQYRVKFYQRVQSGLFEESMKVTVGAGQTIAAQTTVLLELNTLQNTSYVLRVSDWFIPPSNGNFNFAFHCYSIANQFNLLVDYIIIEEEVVPLCFPPTGLTVTNITSTSADLEWLAPSTPPSVGYEYAVTTSATPPATGTATTSTTAVATGLSAATQYYLHVRSDCSVAQTAWVTSPMFNTLICPISNQCDFTFRPYDSFGDGWNNGIMQVKQNGVTIATLTLPAGAGPVDIPVGICDGIPFELVWSACGDYPNEMGIEVLSPYGALLYNLIPGATCTPGSVLFTLTAPSCAPPACGQPSALSVSSITSNTVAISWTAPTPTPNSGYEYAVTTTLTPPASGTLVLATNTTAMGLSAATQYFLHVRSDCGAGNLSGWTTSVPFYTALDCASAIALTLNVPVTSGNLAITGGAYNVNSCGFPTPGIEKLYSFTAPVSGAYDLNITNVNGGMGYNDYFFKVASSGCGATAWTCIDDNNSTGLDQFTLVGGTTYFILLDAEANTGTANHTFQIDISSPIPPNDACTDATLLTVQSGAGCPGAITGTTLGATQSTSPPSTNFSTSNDDDVWYTFVATASDLEIRLCNIVFFGAQVDMAFDLHTDCSSTNLLGGILPATAGGASITLIGFVVGNTYKIRLLTAGSTSRATFDIAIIGPTPPSVELTLNQTFIEGYLNGASMRPVLMNSGVVGATATQCDTIQVALHASTSPYALVYSDTTVLGTNGTAVASFPAAAAGGNYYIVVNGRNLIQTWSANPVTMASSVSYHFGAASQAFGNNLGLVGTIPVMFSGDIDQDGVVDLADYPIWETDYNNFVIGYAPTDLGGDGVVDLVDYPIWEANYNNFVSVSKP
jgi:hypothetical protein